MKNADYNDKQNLRPKMSRMERAKQFMPFAALKGFKEALNKKEKITVPKMELSPEYLEELDKKLQMVRVNDMASVIYFCRGEYLELTGKVTRLDKDARIIKIVQESIPLDDLYKIDIINGPQ